MKKFVNPKRVAISAALDAAIKASADARRCRTIMDIEESMRLSAGRSELFLERMESRGYKISKSRGL